MMKSIPILICALISVAAVTGEDDLDVEARRLRDAPVCFCAPPPEITCKEKQKKETYLSDDICKCQKVRCVWEVCPKVQDVECGKCEVKVEVDDCGCKKLECQAKSPKNCPKLAVDCLKCQTIKQEKDECGCPVDKCVPLPKPPSKCPCGECETCVEVDVGPKGCELMEEVCVAKKCPPFEEIDCDPVCETMEFVEDKCRCASMKCVKKSGNTKKPVCDECHELKLMKGKKCDVWECVPKRCEGPPEGKEVCFTAVEGKTDKCGCKTYKPAKCNLVPAGDCPKGTVAEGGFDLCGCPHQICVPCEQIYPEPKCKHACEKKEKRKAANGQCEEIVCVPTPECKCPQSKPGPCGPCEKNGKVKLSEHCTVDACIPSDAKKCVCKDILPKAKSCGKCEVMKAVKAGKCAGVKTCAPMAVSDCPKLGEPNCPPCQKPVVSKDACGCPKNVCQKAQCAKLSKKLINCEKNELKKKSTIGVDACNCPVHTCVDKEKVCEDENPFAEYGDFVFRNERHSGISSTDALINVNLPNLKSGDGFADLKKPLQGAWINKEFIQQWNQNMKSGPKTKVRFTFWKREGGKVNPVVDIIFNGANSAMDNWFTKDRVLQIVKGPNVKKNIGFNFWSFYGHKDIKRDFFVNTGYGGCPGDKGMIVVADKVDNCAGVWMGGKGWESFPRFLYASNPDGCVWKDTNCAKEADVFTISVL